MSSLTLPSRSFHLVHTVAIVDVVFDVKTNVVVIVDAVNDVVDVSVAEIESVLPIPGKTPVFFRLLFDYV